MVYSKQNFWRFSFSLSPQQLLSIATTSFGQYNTHNSCNKQKSRDQRSTPLTSITFYSPSRSPFYSECPKHACNPLPLGIFELLNATSFPQFVSHLLLCLEFVYLAKGAKKRDNEYGIFTISSSTPPMVKGLLFPLSLALLFMYFDELLCLWFLVFFAFLLNVWLFLHFFFFLGSMNAIWFPHFCHCVPSRLRREVNNLCPGQTPPVPTIGSTNQRPRKPTNHTPRFPRQLTVTSHHHNVSYLFCVRIWCLTVVSSIWTWKTVPMRWQFLARILYAPHLLWNVDPLVSRTSKGPFKTSVWVLCLNIWMNMSIYHFNLKLKAMFWS